MNNELYAIRSTLYAMKYEPRATNHASRNRSSTSVERTLQITPFYAKQTQS